MMNLIHSTPSPCHQLLCLATSLPISCVFFFNPLSSFCPPVCTYRYTAPTRVQVAYQLDLISEETGCWWVLSLKKPFIDNSQLGVALSGPLPYLCWELHCLDLVYERLPISSGCPLPYLRPRPSSQHKADLFVSQRQKAENKRQRKEIEGKGEGKRNKG